MTGREGIPIVHVHAFGERELNIRHVLSEPGEGTRGVGEPFAALGDKAGEKERNETEDTVSNATEKEQQQTDDIREVGRQVRDMTIEKVSAGGVTVAKEEM